MTPGVLTEGRRLAMHESFHCAGLMAFGIVPVEVRTDYPGRGLAGVVRLDDDWDPLNRDTAHNVLVAVVLGPLADGAKWGWPLDPSQANPPHRRDYEAAAVFADFLEMDAVDWLGVLAQARSLARSRRFRRLALALADALERAEVLDRDDLQRIYDANREEPRCNT